MNIEIRGEARRFLMTGIVNTTVTYAIYLGLLHILTPDISYAAAFIVGILLAYVLNTSYVFRVPAKVRSLALFPLIYLVQYLLGAAALRTAINLVGVSPQFAALASIAVTVPATFVLSRSLLKPGRVSETNRDGLRE